MDERFPIILFDLTIIDADKAMITILTTIPRIVKSGESDKGAFNEMIIVVNIVKKEKISSFSIFDKRKQIIPRKTEVNIKPFESFRIIFEKEL